MNKLNRSIRWIKLLSIVSVPFMLKGIAKKVHAIVVGRPGRVDNFLWATNDMGGVCHNVTGFVNGLVAVGVVSATRVGFLGPLSIVASVLCLAGPLAMARGMVQTFVFSRKFDKALHFEKDGSITDDNFNRALDFLIAQQNLPRKKRDRHHYMLGKHFAYNGTVLNKQLTEIRQHSDGLNTADKSALMKRLRGRVTVKQASTVFGIANGLIGFAACPVFVLAPIYCPPLIPLGFVFGGLNAGGQAVRFFIDWYTEHRFEKSVKGFAAKAAPAV